MVDRFCLRSAHPGLALSRPVEAKSKGLGRPLRRRLHADDELLAKRAESFGQRGQFRSMAGIENATDFLLVFPDSSPQLGLADARAFERLQHSDLGRDLRLDRYRNQASSFRFRIRNGEVPPWISQK